ncbi:oligosaccharide flippase family protein [Pseudoduganella sp. FT25W]|uniref:Oligosaccharide flippase family protein n=1 Tax=Duganella alba TaxID=2666081 RepID=A0A6L5QA19_9BURK|nr:lipopolysaccharide biosynthesis protein [Duganella alba]MRX06440.1 oligosaccharide flippase family protein [Duganella alba]MRX14834.1 oligosaccharide flippase family protein [Duganella alba]
MKPHRSFLFSFSEKYTLLVLNTIGAMVLARLLTPADVGVYAVGAVMIGMVQALRDFGVGAYVIHARELDRQQLRAALGVSILVAWTLALLVLAISVPAAWFYQDGRLRTVLQLLAINFALIPFSAVALPYLRRQMRFSAIFAINTSQCAAQMLCSIVLAKLGWGYLSLAWGAVAGAVGTLLATMWWRPSGLPWLPGRQGIRKILSFGSVSTAGTLIDEAGVAAPDLIIGKMTGLAEVGIYSKAMGVINVFNQLVTAAVSPVIFPLFSLQAREGHDLRQAYLTTVSYMTALAWPFFGFVALMAPALVRVLYGDQWDAAVPLIRIICIASALYSMFSMARYLFVAMGEVQAQARLDVMAVPVRVIAVLAAAPFGLEWVGWAVLLGAVFRSGLTFFYLRRLVGMRWRQLLAASRRSGAVAGLCLCGVAAVRIWQPAAQALPQLAVAAVVCALLWFAAIHYVRHALANECTLAARKALALLQR